MKLPDGMPILPFRTRRGHTLLLAVVCLIAFCTASMKAQTNTSPQGGAAIFTGPNAICASSQSGISGAQNFQPCVDPNNNGQWFTVMNASIKTSTNKTLFVSPSLVTGLYTNTLVKGGSSGTSQTATAVASVAVRVLLDCSNCAMVGSPQTTAAYFAAAGYPDAAGSGIVFDARIQQLTATLGSVITSTCLVDLTTCTPEQIDLILSTTSAHSFNFILPTVGSGQHVITVQARLDAGNVCYNNLGTVTTCDNTNVVNTSLASSVSAALFGLGSVTVMPVQLAPGFSF
jgi:hypothetical protein